MYHCFVCHKQVETRTLLSNHMKIQHHIYKNSEHKCWKCSKVCDGRISLYRHFSRNKACRGEVSSKSTELQLTKDNQENYENNEPGCNGDANIEFPDEDKTNHEHNDSKDLVEHTKKSTDEVFASIKSFLCILLGHNSISRKMAFEIFCFMQEKVVHPFLDMTEKLVDGVMLEKISNISIVDMLNEFRCNLSQISTEYKFCNYLQKEKLFHPPKEYTLSRKIVTKISTTGSKIEWKNITVDIPDIVENVRLFIEIPGVLDSILTYQESLEQSNALISLINGSRWKSLKEMNPGKVMIPTLLFVDDFVLRNGMSHQKNLTKLTGLYLIFPTLPPYQRSRLDNILLASLIQTTKIKKYGNGRCFSPLIEALKKLENGINVHTNNKNEIIHVMLFQIVGDNLGLKEILNYVPSFNNLRYCRICTDTKENMEISKKEKQSLLRTEETYREAILVNKPKETGIKSICPFNQLENFKAYENTTVDIFHDLFQGICHLEVTMILEYFINSGSVDIDSLNKFRACLTCEPGLKNHAETNFSVHHIVTTRKLPLTGQQNKQFVLFLPILLLNFDVDTTSNYYKLLLSLIDIIELSLRPIHDRTSLIKLEKSIARHHEIFLELGFALIPKHHHLLHYVTVIKQLGPLCHLSAHRGEQKHRQFKLAAAPITTQKNLGKTLAIKSTYSLITRSLAGWNATEKEFGRNIDQVDIETFKKISTDVNPFTEIATDFFFVSYAKIDGIDYRKNLILRFDNGNTTKLFIISNVITNGKKTFLLSKELLNIKYRNDLRCFIIEPTLQSCEFSAINPDDAEYWPGLQLDLATGEIAVKIYKQLERIK